MASTFSLRQSQIEDIQQNGWCQIDNIDMAFKSKMRQTSNFFDQFIQFKASHSNHDNTLGFFANGNCETIKVLTGGIYESLSDDNNQIAFNKTFGKELDNIALHIFQAICAQILKKDWIKISTQNEISITQNHYYAMAISEYIVTNWSNHKMIAMDVISLISLYHSSENMKKYNYGSFEAIKYKSPTKIDQTTPEIIKLYINGDKGLQFYDHSNEHKTSPWIDADLNYRKTRSIYCCIGDKFCGLNNDEIPACKYRVINDGIFCVYTILGVPNMEIFKDNNVSKLKNPMTRIREYVVPIDKHLYLMDLMMLSGEKMGNIMVKSLNGIKSSMTVDLNGDVWQIRDILAEKEGIPQYSGYILIFKGKMLQDTDILSERGVGEGMTVHLGVRVM